MSVRGEGAAHPPGSPAKTWRLGLAVAVLLTLQAALAVRSLVEENPTVDEVIHLPAGISYWQTGRFRLYHHNPPLVKLIAALPVLAAGVETAPLYQSSYFRSDPPNKAGFAHEFALINARDYFELFTRARLFMPLFAVMGGLAVFFWSRDLFGAGGGLLSLALWCLCPNVLAHCRLITTDAPAAALGVGSTYLFWRFLRRPSWPRAILVGVALGLAALTKFSLLLLFILWPGFWLARMVCDRVFSQSCRLGLDPASPGNNRTATREASEGLGPDPAYRSATPQPPTPLGRQLAQGAVIVLLSLLVINLGYGFEGFGQPLGKFVFYSRTLTRDRVPVPPGPESDDLFRETLRLRVNRFRGTILENLPVPLPREFVLGFDDQKFEAEGVPLRARDRHAPADAVTGYPVYLDGAGRDRSWWDYYLRALLYKVPEGTWLLVLLSLAVLAGSRRARAVVGR